MKKVTYALLTAMALISLEVNSTSLNSAPYSIVSTETTTTDILNYLTTNLGLSATQKPAVKTAVDEAGSEFLKLKSSTKSAAEVTSAKTSIVNGLIKKLSSGVLNSTQSTKLSSLSGELTSLFSKL